MRLHTLTLGPSPRSVPRKARKLTQADDGAEADDSTEADDRDTSGPAAEGAGPQSPPDALQAQADPASESSSLAEHLLGSPAGQLQPEFEWATPALDLHTAGPHGSLQLAEASQQNPTTIVSDVPGAAGSVWPASPGQLNLAGPLLLSAAAGVGAVASHARGTNPAAIRPLLTGIQANAATDTLELRFATALDAERLPQPSQFTLTQGGQTFAIAGMRLSADGLSLSLEVQGDLRAQPLSLRFRGQSPDPQDFVQGLVADGYIRGARIYIDLNGDGLAQATEDTGISTDAQGGFLLTGELPAGALMAVGGINTDSGLLQSAPLRAPQGALVINPLTTLVQEVMDQTGGSASVASDKVSQALGLPPGLALDRYNPLADEQPTSLVVQKIAAQVNNLLLFGSAGDGNLATGIGRALAGQIVSHTTGRRLDLSDGPTLGHILDQAQADGATSYIVLANTLVQESTEVAQISQAQASLAIYKGLSNEPPASTPAPATLAALMGAGPNGLIHRASLPTVDLDQADGATQSTVALVGLTAAGARVHIRLAEGFERELSANAQGQWRYVLTAQDIRALPQGAQSLQVWTVGDSASASPRVEVAVEVDTLAPSLSAAIVSPGTLVDGAWTTRTPLVTLQVMTEPGAVLLLREGTGATRSLSPDSQGQVSAMLSDRQGPHTLSLQARDAAGNTSEAISLSCELDSLAPGVYVSMGTEPLAPVVDAEGLYSGNQRVVRFRFDERPDVALSEDHVGQWLTVTGGTLTGFSELAASAQGWTQTATFHASSDVLTAGVTLRAGLLSDPIGNLSSEASAKVLVLPLASATPGDAHIIASVVTLLARELGQLPFVVDLTHLAGWLMQHAFIEWSDAPAPSFRVGFSDSTDALRVPMRTDLGWQGLSFNVTGSDDPALYLNIDGAIAGRLDDAGRYYLETGPSGSHLSLAVCADIPNDLSLSGTLGPLTLSATNIAPNDATSALEGRVPDAFLSATLTLTDPGTDGVFDDRLSWAEIQAHLSNPLDLFEATVSGHAQLRFETTAQIDTGLEVLDSLLPRFVAELSATQQISSTLGATTGLSYSTSLGLSDTRIASDVLSDILLPVLNFANDNLISPFYSLIAFLERPLLTSSQTYQAPERQTPAWYDAVGWATYAVQTAMDSVRETTSELIDSSIQSLFGLLDGNDDGQVTVLELVTEPIDLMYAMVYGVYAGPGGSMIAQLEVDEATRAKLDDFIAKHPLFVKKAEAILALHSAADALRAFLENVHNFQDTVEELTGLSRNEQNQWADRMQALGGIPLGDFTLQLNGQVGQAAPAVSQHSASLAPVSTEQALQHLLGDHLGAKVYGQLHELGVALPFLTDSRLLGHVLSGQTVDLVHVDLQLPTVVMAFKKDLLPMAEAMAALFTGGASAPVLEQLKSLAKLNLDLSGSLTLVPNVSAGLDTWGLNQWLAGGMKFDTASLNQVLDNFYLDDHRSVAPNGQTTDLPELSVAGDLGLQGGASVGSPFAGAHLSLGLALDALATLDLRDPSPDGKVRLSDLLAQLLGPLELQLDHLGVGLSASAEAWLDLGQPIPSGTGFIATQLAGLGSSVLQFLAPNKYTVALPDLNLYFPLVDTAHAVL